MKTVLFVPGFRAADATRFDALFEAIHAKGYRVEFVPIDWKGTTLTGWTRNVEAAYADHDPQKTILAGHSLGAYTLLNVAATCSPAELWLMSLSCWFAEDLEFQKAESLTYMGPRRVSVFGSTHFSELAPKVRCKTLLFVGKRETDLLKARVDAAHHTIAGSRKILIPKTKHDVTQRRYVEAIRDAI